MKTLMLTDHSGHREHNSLYALARTLAAHPVSEAVHVASRGNTRNQRFFAGAGTLVRGKDVNSDAFGFDPTGRQFTEAQGDCDPSDYDLIWLRLPPPADPSFFAYLESLDGPTIVNRPRGMLETGSKAFLLHFPEWTAPTQLITSTDQLRDFAGRFPLVLKPLRDYGGHGLIRIQSGTATVGDDELSFDAFASTNRERIEGGAYLAMKFLENVTEGDKRILVAGDRILGASLRLPSPGQWLCNVSRGGTSIASGVTQHERAMIAALAPELTKRGVFFFGVDTLLGDEGERVLSEINTHSIGGFAQAQAQSGEPVLRRAVEALIEHLKFL